MASEVSICNLALAKLGDTASISSISPPDDSVQAAYCSQFYPIAVASMLDRHAWSFATRRYTLPLLTNDHDEWLYAYAMPSDYLSINKVLIDGSTRCEAFSLEIHDDGELCLRSNDENLVLVYTSATVTADKYPPLFVDALATLLAYHLAGPILKGDIGVAAGNKLLSTFQLVYKLAVEDDSRDYRFLRPAYTPEGIAARA
jgi:hypothetical protein